jgi:N-acetylneuraminic acid mutarotase
MRYRSILHSALALSTLWLAACTEETTTEPTEAQPPPGAPALAIVSNSWIQRTDMRNRTGLAAATVTNAAGQSIVYAIGGLGPEGRLDRVTAYNVATNTWTVRRSLPVPLAWSNGAGVINGKIYVSGGWSQSFDAPTKALYVYNPFTNSWTRKRDMPAIGSDGVTAVINGKLYVTTACYVASEDPWGYYETCPPWLFRYNPATDQWARLRSPPTVTGAVSPYMGGAIGGKFYVMGNHAWSHDGWMVVYNPATNQWTAKTPLALTRPGAATAVLGAKLYVMGGERYNATRGWEKLDVTIAYDPATDAWTRRASLPSPRTGVAASTVLLNGKQRIELLGGNAPGNNLQYIP